MIDGTLPGYWENRVVNFSVTNAALAKVLVDVTPAVVVAAVSGESALPGESVVRQRVLTGGCRVIDGQISSTDAAEKNLRIFTGRQTTLVADMGTPGRFNSTTTITRASGSFITDVYAIGDTIMVFGATTAANSGVLGVVTGVAALTLTVSAAIYTVEDMPAGSRIIRVALRTQKTVPASAGSSSTVPNVVLLGGSQDLTTDTGGIMLDATGMLIVAMVAAVAALPATVNVTAYIGRY